MRPKWLGGSWADQDAYREAQAAVDNYDGSDPDYFRRLMYAADDAASKLTRRQLRRIDRAAERGVSRHALAAGVLTVALTVAVSAALAPAAAAKPDTPGADVSVVIFDGDVARACTARDRAMWGVDPDERCRVEPDQDFDLGRGFAAADPWCLPDPGAPDWVREANQRMCGRTA